MLLKLENPKLFSDLISIISELVTEVRLKITKEGMNLTAIDPANVAMVYFKIPSDLFAQFELEKEEIIGINLENLKAVLRRCKPGSALTLAREDNMLKLGIQDKIRRDSEALAEVVEDCLVVADACTFFAEPKKFIVEAHGLNSARAEFSSEEIELYSDTSKARFSLEYLNKFVKGAKIY